MTTQWTRRPLRQRLVLDLGGWVAEWIVWDEPDWHHVLSKP